MMDRAGQTSCHDLRSRARALTVEDGEVLRPATRLYQDLDQVLRLCVSPPFDPAAAGMGIKAFPARAADVPDFATLVAYLAEMREKVRGRFVRIVEEGGSVRQRQGIIAGWRCDTNQENRTDP